MSLCASVYMFFVVTSWERADLLALVCGVCCEFVTFPLVSWVRCGTLLYRFLIFTPLLTFIQNFTLCKEMIFYYDVLSLSEVILITVFSTKNVFLDFDIAYTVCVGGGGGGGGPCFVF